MAHSRGSIKNCWPNDREVVTYVEGPTVPLRTGSATKIILWVGGSPRAFIKVSLRSWAHLRSALPLHPPPQEFHSHSDPWRGVPTQVGKQKETGLPEVRKRGDSQLSHNEFVE